MRHRLAGRKLGRNTHERRSLFRNLIRSLILTERIKTTVAKAKTIRPLVDKLMTQAKQGTLAGRRRVLAALVDRPVVDKLVKELAPRTGKRTSGFTRIQRLGRRLGDNSLMAIIEWVDKKVEAPAAAKAKAGKE
ncbi:50S ribosomal protein L17 [Candidatus Beckwithbacteria bacterium RIFCSPLOWO2_02_FULL_47_23]|uniref:Large ribosomal subunit protein bL17 n=2 Tax=Candidatus Beckwithiibacteriota TaxID=1752726 RepID=A0A1F5E3D2_9BACT|nr:MAG: 50S ribosomal protein L17 [Candidatus Beckwithbacteria bacterium RIFCSPHIGHO2_12_FULL_47_17]OGD61868.1 MAG: 50S ribosomal protein L17 [Candidatus Beckwithbacteria bacterium RIFCSPLOWO2_02_FULL_47_23]